MTQEEIIKVVEALSSEEQAALTALVDARLKIQEVDEWNRAIYDKAYLAAMNLTSGGGVLNLDEMINRISDEISRLKKEREKELREAIAFALSWCSKYQLSTPMQLLTDPCTAAFLSSCEKK